MEHWPRGGLNMPFELGHVVAAICIGLLLGGLLLELWDQGRK